MKKFTKKISITYTIIFSVLFCALALFTFVPMKWGTDNYNSAFGAVSVSGELQDKIVAVYDIQNDPTEDEINASLKTINSLLTNEGYSVVSVSKLDNTRISVEIARPAVNDDYSNAVNFLQNTITGGEIIFSTASSFDKINDEGELTLYASKNIDKVSIESYHGNVGVEISYKFTREEKAAGLNNAVYKQLYMYRDGEAFPSSGNNTLSSSGSNSSTTTLWFKDTEGTPAYKSAEYYQKIFEAGRLSTKLSSDNVSIYDAPAAYKTPYLSMKDILLIIMLVLVVVFYVLEIVKWRALGVISFISFASVAMISIFTFSLMNWVSLSIASFVAMIMTISIVIITNSLFFNKISNEYALGKSISTSIESAYKKVIPYSVVTSVVMFVIGIAIALIGQSLLASIGTIIAVGGVVNIISSIGITRLLLLIYESYNNNPKSYGLKEESNKNETL